MFSERCLEDVFNVSERFYERCLKSFWKAAEIFIGYSLEGAWNLEGVLRVLKCVWNFAGKHLVLRVSGRCPKVVILDYGV